MTVEEALAIVDTALKPEFLSDVQELVFCQCWLGETYQQIADNYGYDGDYIRSIGSRLWQKLSEVFEQKITKSNFRSVIRKRSLINSAKEHSIEASLQPSQILEVPGGQIPLDSPFFIEPDEVSELYRGEIVKPGALIRIFAPRQWGKTSLMLRILAYAASKGYRTIGLNLQQADTLVLSSLDKFLRWFCANLTQQLQLQSALDDYWDCDLGSKVSCTNYLQQYLLANTETPIVLALDEVNWIFEHPHIAVHFLPLLRFWHEERNNLHVWKKLRLVVVHSTEVYIPLNFYQSPFNVGLSIKLRSFSFEQMKDLAKRHGLSAKNLKPLRAMIDGHPYLVRLAFYNLCRGEVTMEQLLQEAPTQAGIYSHHLRGILATLQEHSELGGALKKAILAHNPVKIETIGAYKLQSMGLVKFHGDLVVLSCELYRLYFRDRLDQF